CPTDCPSRLASSSHCTGYAYLPIRIRHDFSRQNTCGIIRMQSFGAGGAAPAGRKTKWLGAARPPARGAECGAPALQTPRRGRPGDDDGGAAMGGALDRLYGAAAHSVAEIVADLTPSERARLAVFCYGRAHLNLIGLAIAATCGLEQLIGATHSVTAGRTI